MEPRKARPRRIRLSYLCFGSVIVSSIALAPVFGNFTAERLPVLLVIAIIAGLIWGLIGGSVLRIR